MDIGDTLSSYRYPHIVVSCDDEAANGAYSPVYGRLLVDRCVLDGLLVEESEGVFVPKEDVENVEVEGYYSYPKTHVTIRDRRSEGLEVKTKLCTQRGFDGATFSCAEGKQKAECSWCVFMKSGPCFRPFEGWQKCMIEFGESEWGKEEEGLSPEEQEARRNAFVNSCGAVTLALKRCVDAHPEYYGKLSQPSESAESQAEASPSHAEEGKETELAEKIEAAETDMIEKVESVEMPKPEGIEVIEEPKTEVIEEPKTEVIEEPKTEVIEEPKTEGVEETKEMAA